MAGSKIGGEKAAKTNKERHGEDFYRNIALKAQKAWEENGRKPRGFAANPELARRAGMKGGKTSRRGKAKPNQIKENEL